MTKNYLSLIACAAITLSSTTGRCASTPPATNESAANTPAKPIFIRAKDHVKKNRRAYGATAAGAGTLSLLEMFRKRKNGKNYFQNEYGNNFLGRLAKLEGRAWKAALRGGATATALGAGAYYALNGDDQLTTPASAGTPDGNRNNVPHRSGPIGKDGVMAVWDKPEERPIYATLREKIATLPSISSVTPDEIEEFVETKRALLKARRAKLNARLAASGSATEHDVLWGEDKTLSSRSILELIDILAPHENSEEVKNFMKAVNEVADLEKALKENAKRKIDALEAKAAELRLSEEEAKRESFYEYSTRTDQVFESVNKQYEEKERELTTQLKLALEKQEKASQEAWKKHKPAQTHEPSLQDKIDMLRAAQNKLIALRTSSIKDDLEIRMAQDDVQKLSTKEVTEALAVQEAALKQMQEKEEAFEDALANLKNTSAAAVLDKYIAVLSDIETLEEAGLMSKQLADWKKEVLEKIKSKDTKNKHVSAYFAKWEQPAPRDQYYHGKKLANDPVAREGEASLRSLRDAQYALTRESKSLAENREYDNIYKDAENKYDRAFKNFRDKKAKITTEIELEIRPYLITIGEQKALAGTGKVPTNEATKAAQEAINAAKKSKNERIAEEEGKLPHHPREISEKAFTSLSVIRHLEATIENQRKKLGLQTADIANDDALRRALWTNYVRLYRKLRPEGPLVTADHPETEITGQENLYITAQTRDTKNPDVKKLRMTQAALWELNKLSAESTHANAA